LEGARDHASFVRIARRLIVANAHSRFDRISRVRALRRQLASHVVHSRTSPAKTTLIDEGILGSVHSALVYCHRRPDESEVIELANAMPKPDLIVHLDTPIEVCVARALRRSDPPLRGANAGDIEKFVRNGHEAFQFAGRAAAFEGRWKTLVPEQSTNDSQALANDAWKLISKHLIQ
jgi:thymidylate kinase